MRRAIADPVALAQVSGRPARCGVDGKTQPPDPPPDQRFLPRIADAQGHVGLASGQVQHCVGNDHLDFDLGPCGAKGGDMGGQHAHRQQVGGGDADGAMGPLVLPGHLQRQRGDFFLDADDGIAHLSARRRQRIAAG